MLTKILMAAAIIFTVVAVKADQGQAVKSKVQKVTVFLSGAQVTRSATVNIVPGTTDLIFSNISPEIDARSIQVNANGEFTILSVKHELNYLNDQTKSKKKEELEALQKLVKDKITLQDNMLSIYQSEENTLMKNQLVKAENATLDVSKLKQALDFQTERLTAIREKELAITNRIETLNAELQKYYLQANVINQKNSSGTSNIVITVASTTALQATFLVSYLINDARWSPAYDIKAKNTNSPLVISYNANVLQTTGEDWKNVKLTLSTGNPRVSGIKPELNPYYLNFSAYLQGRASGASMSEVVVTGYATERKELISGTIPLSVSQVENQTNIEFNIDNPYTIASDGKTCLVKINQFEVKAGYQYYVAPKLSADVFLTAQITDWNKYNFLSGEANLFFEGTYIGKSNIDANSVSDTLSLSLGIDKSIVVKRTLQKDISERSSLGSTKKETKSWLIAVKNRKNQRINLLVEDQVPVSQVSAIEVEAQETSGAKVDPLTGKISWNFLLNSQADKKLQLKYTVKYPKNQLLTVQ